MRALTTPDALALLAVAGFALLAVSLGLPWSEERSCPLFEECGPWEPVTGWEAAGPPAAGLVALAAVATVGLHRRPMARLAAFLVLAAVAGIGLAYTAQWADFVIFGDARFPLEGFGVACAGAALAFAASVAGLLAGSRSVREAPRPDGA